MTCRARNLRPDLVQMVPLAQSPNETRETWLRRFSSADPNGSGRWHRHRLYAIGNAAARETLVSGTHHMSAIWTSLFADLLCAGTELRWVDDGPGQGRDARIAYSSLLGRYVARAYLTANEGVRVLVPLDVAKRRLQQTPYSIDKVRSGNRGLQADWIGLDSWGRLIIAEAKGSFDGGKGTWHGPSCPQLLKTAQRQAKRTVVRCGGRQLRARRWAVVCRWGTDDNKREPTVLAACDGGDPLDYRDYVALAQHLFDLDRHAVLEGLGHGDAAARLGSDDRPRERLPGDLRLSIRGYDFPWGFPAVAGPFGFRPLRGTDDLVSARTLLVDSPSPQIAAVSFSSRYASSVPEPTDSQLVGEFDEEGDRAHLAIGDDFSDVAEFAGMSTAWLREPNDIVIRNA